MSGLIEKVLWLKGVGVLLRDRQVLRRLTNVLCDFLNYLEAF